MNALDELIEQARQDDPILAGQAALELTEMRSIISALLTEYWQADPRGYITCRYCGAGAERGVDIKHRLTCPVKRGRIFLTWPDIGPRIIEEREEVAP
jgi:hypothetical protein